MNVYGVEFNRLIIETVVNIFADFSPQSYSHCVQIVASRSGI